MINLIVQCKRESTTHLLVALQGDIIALLYGTIEDGDFKGGDGDALSLSENPEFCDLYDGHAWNVAALQNLVIDAYCGENC